MAVRYSVHADSEEECADAVDELCARLGAVPAMKPVRLTIADGRWLARAIASVVDQRGQVQPGFTCTQPQDAS